MLDFDSKALAARLIAAPPAVPLAFAVWCAQRLIARRPPADANLLRLISEALVRARDVAAGDGSRAELATLSQKIEARPELDDDPVAATAYVLRYVLSNDIQNAVWAAQRAFDASYAAAIATLPDSVYAKAADADLVALPVVQSELAEQEAMLVRLEAGAA